MIAFMVFMWKAIWFFDNLIVYLNSDSKPLHVYNVNAKSELVETEND